MIETTPTERIQMPDYVYATTRTGEAQHAAAYDGRSAAVRTVCGRRVASAYGPAFSGSTGIQHPWRCERCHRTIKTEEV